MPSSYLVELWQRVSTGLQRWSPQRRAVHRDFLRSLQHPDGGFPGRQAASNLYYTSFALQGLAVLGGLDGTVAERATAFLRNQSCDHLPAIDLVSLVFAAGAIEWAGADRVFAEDAAATCDRLAAALEAFRRPDGGYAKTNEGHASSTYQTFLTLLALQHLGRPIPEPEQIADFLLSQGRDDHGFVEIRASRRSGTNPTAAAIGTLKMLEPQLPQLPQMMCDKQCIDTTAEFLRRMQTAEGGFRANTRIPIDDLLSTFTAMQALDDLGALAEIDLPAARRFVDSLQQPEGGWHGALWDEETDAEYTFYGLAATGLLLGETFGG